MKTFSVQFFKRLILFILVWLILVPTGFAIFFGIQYSRLEKQLAGGGGADPNPTHPAVDPLPLEGEALAYQELYPELYSTAQVSGERESRANTVYLTIDTSLNANTRQILNTLDQYGIKATFFVSGTSDIEAMTIMQEIVNRGHTIGLQSYSGSYSDIYRSVSSYLDDFKQIYDLVYNATAVKAEIFRFLGGSVNPYNFDKFRELNAEMLRRNFVFFDWSVSAQGAESAEEGEAVVLSGCAVQGNVTSTSSVTVDETAMIVGDVLATDFESAGKVKGNIQIARAAIFFPTAILAGNVMAGTIMMNQGARIQGAIRIAEDPETNALFGEGLEI